MRTLIYTLVILLFFAQNLTGQKYQELIIETDNPSAIKSPDVAKQIEENCAYLSAETAWHLELSSVNNDQCQLYTGYTSFSNEKLRWIDEVKISTEMDETVGMEVEVLTFYKDGQEVEPRGFLESQIEPCKSLDSKEGMTSCLTHFQQISMEMKRMVDASVSLAKQAPEVIKNTDDAVSQELNTLKGSRSLADIKRAKLLKNKAKSIQTSVENSKALMPNLTKTIASDYAIIIGVTKTLNRLESGL